jgi:hypothetical protein
LTLDGAFLLSHLTVDGGGGDVNRIMGLVQIALTDKPACLALYFALDLAPKEGASTSNL